MGGANDLFIVPKKGLLHVCLPSWELELRPLGVATGNAFSVTRV